MRNVNPQPFYIAFTEGWGTEPIVKCTPVAELDTDPRVVLVSAKPGIFIEGKYLSGQKDTRFDQVFIFDRFSTDRWLPLRRATNIGVLVGEEDVTVEPDLNSLELVFWATAFSTRAEAEEAREKLG